MFDSDSWHTAAADKTAEIKNHISAFEEYMLYKLPPEEKKTIHNKAAASLWDVKRLHQLRTMLTFEPPADIKDEWLERTRYMEIEHPNPDYPHSSDKKTINEYSQRPVLPEPDEVIKKETYK